MIMGLDFPYWETFNLRAVFPYLQDKLTNFPEATVYNDILSQWRGLRPDQQGLFQTPDLRRKIATLYGMYLVALSRGATPYQLHPLTPPRFKTAEFLQSQTGIDRASVVAFLTSLERLAKAGKIGFQYWNPERAVEGNKAVTTAQTTYNATKPKSDLQLAVQSGAKWIGFGALGLGALAAFTLLKRI